jgi:dipeptidyl-peptidase-4
MLYTSLDAHEKRGSDAGPPPGFLETYKKPLVFLASVASIVGIILIIVFVLLDHTGMASDSIEKYPFTLATIFNTSLSPNSVSVQWEASGSSYLYEDKSTGDWYRYSVNTNITTLVVNQTELATGIPGYSSLTFSTDGNYALVSYNITAVWRHSFLASYRVYNVNTKTQYSLVTGDPQLQNVVWNPTNYQVAYVQNYNIYVIDASSAVSTPTEVTDDGDVENGILNGIQSWVYEEEIFSDFSAVWWSADGTLLAYLRFDESEVPIFEYAIYTGSAYPTEIPLKYPKAGYTNPSVRLYVFDTQNGTSLGFPYLEFGAGGFWEYIASVQWRADNSLWIQQLNRYQNVTSIQVLSQQNGVWLNETALSRNTSKWIDIFPLYFYNNYNLAIIPNNGYYHIANIQNSAGTWTSTFLTSGNFDIISIYGFASDGKLYYSSTPPINPTAPVAATLQHIYKYDPTNGNVTQVNQASGVYSASFSPTGAYFVMHYQGPNVPQVFLVAPDLSLNITLENNSAYAENIKHYDLPTKSFTYVTGEAGDILNAAYKTPVGAGSGRPLIIDVYAGPGTQKVRQTHDVAGLDAWLASQGYMVASIDGRGTGRRGLQFLQQTYRQLGLLEMADQRSGAKELAQKLSLVDSGRVAIWGWSYGGFMAAHGIAGTSAIAGFRFKAGVSVAPVSSWAYYDTVYTERFMSTPADNPAGYNATSVLVHAPHTPAHSLLLMHGTGDDNVHFQNTVELANTLITSNVQFSTMFYPNDNHAINSGNARQYLYQKMTDFLQETL